MKKSHEILQIKYSRRFFEIEKMKSFVCTEYIINKKEVKTTRRIRSGDEKRISKKQITEEWFNNLCNDLNECIENSNNLEEYVDDCGVTITIYRAFGRKEIMDRGLSDGKTDVGSIISDYINQL